VNSIERMNAVLSQKSPDKIPIRVGNHNIFLVYYYNITIDDYLNNPALNADLFIKMVREFEFDSLRPARGYIFYGCGPEMGPKWEFVEDNFPAATDGIIDSEDDLDKFEVPAEPEGYFYNYLDINRRVKDILGSETHLGSQILGPFTCAAFLRKYDKLLMDTIQNPTLFAKIMEKAVEVSIYLGTNVMELGYQWTTMLEIFLIPGVINPETYHRIIAPYCDRVRNQLSDPPIPNFNEQFMGRKGDLDSYKRGKEFYEYHFGTSESIAAIKNASAFMDSKKTRQVSLSGNSLVHWPTDKILEFLKQGLDFFINERDEIPFIMMPSLQAENYDQASEVGDKLFAINEFRNSFYY
jgi:hypothetical protein